MTRGNRCDIRFFHCCRFAWGSNQRIIDCRQTRKESKRIGEKIMCPSKAPRVYWRFSYFLKLTGFQRKIRGYELIEYIILALKENPI
jgi:hypothetical protein